jgi:hypothetical protein
MTPDVDAWDPWRPEQVYELLRDCPAPWAIAAGWALDLHHGRETRPHGDIEIGVPRSSFDRLRPYLAGFQLFAAGSGEVDPLTPENLLARRQIWVCDDGLWRMDCFLEPGDTTTWISNRDPRVTLPVAGLIKHTADAIPYQAAETVLFMKAKHTRPKDEHDFALALPTLDSVARAWLTEALELVHPGHAWIERCRAAS